MRLRIDATVTLHRHTGTHAHMQKAQGLQEEQQRRRRNRCNKGAAATGATKVQQRRRCNRCNKGATKTPLSQSGNQHCLSVTMKGATRCLSFSVRYEMLGAGIGEMLPLVRTKAPRVRHAAVRQTRLPPTGENSPRSIPRAPGVALRTTASTHACKGASGWFNSISPSRTVTPTADPGHESAPPASDKTRASEAANLAAPSPTLTRIRPPEKPAV